MRIKFQSVESINQCPKIQETANSICTTESFMMEEMIAAIKTSTLPAFFNKFVEIKELTILGIDGLRTKTATAKCIQEIVLRSSGPSILYSFISKDRLLEDKKFPETIKFLLRE